MSRDEIVERMKKSLDDWNSRISEWEEEVSEAQAAMKSRYQKELDTLRAQREEAMKKLAQAQDSSEAAWKDVSKGFEEAWQDLADSFDNAWSQFRDKEQPGDASKKKD